MRSHLALATALSLIAISNTAIQADDWLGWRGPTGNGVVAESGFTLQWDANKNVQWKTAIPGRGHSSPIVVGERIYLTTAVKREVKTGDKTEVHLDCQLVAVDRRTGEILWQRTAHKLKNPPKIHRTNSYASDTPVSDGKHIWVTFSTFGRLFCYDLDGQQVWDRDFGVPASRNDWGMCTSPILYKDLLIFNSDRKAGSFLTAVNKSTGKQLWRVARDETGGWTVPVIFSAGQRDELVLNAQNYIRGYDPQTGEELWKHAGFEKHIISTPIVHDGLLYVAQGRNVATVAFKPGSRGDITLAGGATSSDQIIWMQPKGGPYCSSQAIAGDYLYTLSDHAVSLLTIFHAKTGEETFKGRFPASSDKFYASPLVVDDKVLVTHYDGTTTVLKAGPKLDVLWKNELGEPVQANLAASDRQLFIRGAKHLYCVGQ